MGFVQDHRGSGKLEPESQSLKFPVRCSFHWNSLTWKWTQWPLNCPPPLLHTVPSRSHNSLITFTVLYHQKFKIVFYINNLFRGSQVFSKPTEPGVLCISIPCERVKMASILRRKRSFLFCFEKLSKRSERVKNSCAFTRKIIYVLNSSTLLAVFLSLISNYNPPNTSTGMKL